MNLSVGTSRRYARPDALTLEIVLSPLRCLSTLALSVLLGACASSQDIARPAVTHPFDGPRITFTRPESDALYGQAYRMALDNVLRINQVDADRAHQQSGLLTGSPARMVRAGAGYEAAWTRDASINSWNALNLLAPGLARNTLFAVVDRSDGGYIVRQDNQQWDQAIWVVAAWHHYLATGDRAFLAIAFDAAERTLATHRAKAFDPASGLFLGPSVINDGISGYPQSVSDATESKGSFVGDYPASARIAALSTNAIHYEAYASAARMARALGDGHADALQAQANALKAAIDNHFWNATTGRYRYLHAPGIELETADSQEGLGLSFTILFGLADGPRSDAIIRGASVASWGIEDVSPAFARYSDERPGRHNNIMWPMTQGFWGSALAMRRDTEGFGTLLRQQAELPIRSGGFWEIYNARSGAVDGGWQTGHHWPAEKDQTWSATAYLRLIDSGLFGLHAEEDGLRVEPLLPADIGPATLEGIRYRAATLTVALRGHGAHIASCRFDGGRCPTAIAPDTRGDHRIEIDLSETGSIKP